MSQRELNRLELLQRVIDRRLTQQAAAKQMSISTRQVRRLIRAYEVDGASGLVSKKRGQRNNNRKCGKLRAMVLGLLRARYADFGPSLANEKLLELHGIRVATETLRAWMTDDGLWLPRRRWRSIHQPRHRRLYLGELVQIDGSPQAPQQPENHTTRQGSHQSPNGGLACASELRWQACKPSPS